MEVYQEYGNDLVVNSNGDLMTVDGTELSNQRIIRRLMTIPIAVNNPPDYIDHPEYGAGLPQFIGRLDTPEIEEQIIGLITSQMFLEESVAKTPPPQITLSGLPNALSGTITYTNLLTNQQVVLGFSVNG